MASLLMQIKLLSVAPILFIVALTLLLMRYVYVTEEEFGRRNAILHEFRNSSLLQDIIANTTATQAATMVLMGKMKIKKLAVVNMEADKLMKWEELGHVQEIRFPRVDPSVTWEDLFPKWLDEEDDARIRKCPEIPMPEPEDSEGEEYDMVVARLPCAYKTERWNRDVFRLQVHLVVAKLASGSSPGVTVVLLSECRPMVELFRCEDLVNRRGNEWVFLPDVERLREKLALPVGSCKLALPLLKQQDRGREIIDYNFSMLHYLHKDKVKRKNSGSSPSPTREAYATVIHSSDSYVCGAIALARSLIHTGTTRDLVLLLHTNGDKDDDYHRRRLALIEAGWKIHDIERIRNPKAKKDAYNKWNYTKLRLWQLTGYRKIIYLDADLVVLKNLDQFFGFPQLSAASNSHSIFNSGLMVIEPSGCTFKILTQHISVVKSYNGGDQGFLNEVFTWWHRLPRRVNMLKIFTSRTRLANNTRIMGSEPPELYALHYLGIKPWLCYRDYDCNWNVENQRQFANDVAHARWWKLHDLLIPKSLQPFCLLSEAHKIGLQKDIENARAADYSDQHWLKAVKDHRQY